MAHPPISIAPLPLNYAKQHGVYIDHCDADTMVVLHRASVSVDTLQELQRCFCDRGALQFREVSDAAFSEGLSSVYSSQAASAEAAMAGLEQRVDLTACMAALPATEDLLEADNDAPVIQLINAVLTAAIQQQASDVHFETFEATVSIRFRIDGVLKEVLRPMRALAPMLISRIKIMAKLDIAEKRLPQDGRLSLQLAGRAVDVRVSTIPAHYGERIVFRLLDQQTIPLQFEQLGMSDHVRAHIRTVLAKSHGILLVTGPTGSGKTTTLYAGLLSLNEQGKNLLTIEDPIEFYLPGVGQTQVNAKVGMTFARGLRAILRQDPDVVMVGEIRDFETAQMAVQASLTGHLVLSTLHTNSALGAVTRLRDMGVAPYLLAASLSGVIAQRLVRVLCRQCKQAEPISPALQAQMALSLAPDAQHYRAVGCEACDHTGYHGRTGIYEVLPVDDALKAVIHGQGAETELAAAAEAKLVTMRQDGWRRVLEGSTTVEEILRVT